MAREAHKHGSYHTTLFLAHQAVEETLKAYLIGHKRARLPRTQELVELAIS